LPDATYIEPITPEYVAKIIEKERPDALLPTMGGQTALNTALALAKDGTLERLGVQLIGANADAIEMAEDRLKFRQAMERIGWRARAPPSPTAWTRQSPRSSHRACRRSSARASPSAAPAAASLTIARSSSTSCVAGSTRRPPIEVLIEESVLGWKEYEMEVVATARTTPSSSAPSRISTRWASIPAIR
jgi:carbamoyl-phosphate synthase large subunit